MRTTTGTCDPEERIDALATAMELLGEDASDALVAEVADALLRAHERTGMDPDTTVVAFLGATGSGKSSLFNALLGADLAQVGVVRPTTRSALAAVQPGHEATHLLHWIGVGHRVQVPAGAGLPPGVALVDLPDIDSLDVANHVLVERLGARVDVLVWVLDPQKYADDIIHTQWIRPLAAHAEVTAAVLTQVDRLPTTERRAVSQDLRRLLAEDGIADPHVLETSAVTGEGIDELRLVIARTAHEVAEKSLRVQGVLDDAVGRVRSEVGGPDLPPFDPQGLSSALVDVAARASGASRVVDAVGGAHLHRGVKATGWLPLRWLRGLRADPLARLHLGGTPGESAPRIPEDTVRAQWASTLSAPRPEGCHTLVALHGLGVAGFLSCAPAPALPPQGGRTDEIPAGTEILTLAVDPDFTRSGHASRLLAALVDITGAPSLREWVTAGDEAHVRFLSSAGFAPAGLRRSLEVGPAPLVEHLWWTLGRRAALGD